jgi:hypothetical protein
MGIQPAFNHKDVIEHDNRRDYRGFVRFKDNTKGIEQLKDKLEMACHNVLFSEFDEKYWNLWREFQFDFNQNVINYHTVDSVEKKYWRAWIDLMQFPVLIDEFPGAPTDTLFHYQARHLISKEKFLKDVQENKNWLKGEGRSWIS